MNLIKLIKLALLLLLISVELYFGVRWKHNNTPKPSSPTATMQNR